MRLTVEVRTAIVADRSHKKWTAQAYIAGAAVISREYNGLIANADKPFPLKLALQIARDARDELTRIEGFEFIFTTGEIGPDFVTFEAPDRGAPATRKYTNDSFADAMAQTSTRSRGISE